MTNFPIPTAFPDPILDLPDSPEISLVKEIVISFSTVTSYMPGDATDELISKRFNESFSMTQAQLLHCLQNHQHRVLTGRGPRAWMRLAAQHSIEGMEDGTPPAIGEAEADYPQSYDMGEAYDASKLNQQFGRVLCVDEIDLSRFGGHPIHLLATPVVVPMPQKLTARAMLALPPGIYEIVEVSYNVDYPQILPLDRLTVRGGKWGIPVHHRAAPRYMVVLHSPTGIPFVLWQMLNEVCTHRMPTIQIDAEPLASMEEYPSTTLAQYVPIERQWIKHGFTRYLSHARVNALVKEELYRYGLDELYPTDPAVIREGVRRETYHLFHLLFEGTQRDLWAALFDKNLDGFEVEHWSVTAKRHSEALAGYLPYMTLHDPREIAPTGTPEEVQQYWARWRRNERRQRRRRSVLTLTSSQLGWWIEIHLGRVVKLVVRSRASHGDWLRDDPQDHPQLKYHISSFGRVRAVVSLVEKIGNEILRRESLVEPRQSLEEIADIALSLRHHALKVGKSSGSKIGILDDFELKNRQSIYQSWHYRQNSDRGVVGIPDVQPYILVGDEGTVEATALYLKLGVLMVVHTKEPFVYLGRFTSRDGFTEHNWDDLSSNTQKRCMESIGDYMRQHLSTEPTR